MFLLRKCNNTNENNKNYTEKVSQRCPKESTNYHEDSPQGEA